VTETQQDFLSKRMVEDAIGPIEDYAKDCHRASLALVKSGLLGREARVARGSARGVGGQHSWVVRGSQTLDIYDPSTLIIDITLWSYDLTKPQVWIGTLRDGIHVPHFGNGNMMEWGCPENGGDEEVILTPSFEVSETYEDWLDLFHRAVGVLDVRFWAVLMSHAPYLGWPSSEFTRAVYDTPGLRPFIPIDRIGMHTDLNPGGLYLLPSEGEN
jgi:hypothetical protein